MGTTTSQTAKPLPTREQQLDAIREVCNKLGMPNSDITAKVLVDYLAATQNLDIASFAKLADVDLHSFVAWVNGHVTEPAITEKVIRLCQFAWEPDQLVIIDRQLGENMRMVTVKVHLDDKEVNVELPQYARINELNQAIQHQFGEILRGRRVVSTGLDPILRLPEAFSGRKYEVVAQLDAD